MDVVLNKKDSTLERKLLQLQFVDRQHKRQHAVASYYQMLF